MTGPNAQQRVLGRNAFILDNFLYRKKAVCFMLRFRTHHFCGSGMELRVCQPPLVTSVWSNSLDESASFYIQRWHAAVDPYI